MKNSVVVRLCSVLALAGTSCSDGGEEPGAAKPFRISGDHDLYAHITGTDPFAGYALFPGVDSVVSGTLNGSTAHQPFVRVSINAKAAGALTSGSLPPGGSFPDGSVIVKEIRMNGSTVLYAVLFKENGNPLSSGGWLWAELTPDGGVFYSVENRGSGCLPCHLREQGAQHDLIRTFERQIPGR